MEYFCAAITERGFYNGFSEVFNEKRLKRLYVIKGASGVGKSTLMKKLAAVGEKYEKSVDRIYCSSDPRSLDGVIVDDIGMIDGTSPHAYEPKMAGAFETLVDLGRFWDRSMLEREQKRITALVDEKRTHFERIYELTAIYGRLSKLLFSERARRFDRDKITASVSSLVKRRLAKGKRGNASMRILSATFNKSLLPPCERHYTVDDPFGFAPLYLEALKAQLEKSGSEFFYSPALPSLERIGAIFIPSQSIIYTTERGGRCIHGERFALTESKEAQPQYTAVLRSLESKAELERAAAMKNHYELERIYAAAMDFDRLEAYTESLIGEIIG